VQISGCTAYCREISQSQIATEENTTVQELVGVLEAGIDPWPQAGTGEASQTTGSVVQIQLGCLSDCFGMTTTNEGAILVPSRQALEAVLATLAPVLPRLNPTPAGDENTTVQTINQWQEAQGLEIVQTQSASEVNATAQVANALSALVADLQAALGVTGATRGEVTSAASEVPADDAVNQTAQGIWQVQIGCLYFCVETEQYQQAVQTNTTTQTGSAQPSSASGSAAAVVNIATQVIWQVQIGCLFWCVNATQQQIADNGGSPVVNGGGTGAPLPPTTFFPSGPGTQQNSSRPATPPSTPGPASSAPGAPPPSTPAPPSTPETPSATPEDPSLTSNDGSVSGSSADLGAHAASSVLVPASDSASSTRTRPSIRLSRQAGQVKTTPGTDREATIHISRLSSSAAPSPSIRGMLSSRVALSTVTLVVARSASGPGHGTGLSSPRHTMAPTSASRTASQQLHLASAVGEGVRSDGTSIVLLAAIVISMLCLVPRRAGR
jgi:hypothetical protein